MGRIWKITMVLLSTLAALVIIVHSAEEDYEAEFSNRRELRHRMLDTGPPRIYDQPWRTMEIEPVMQQTTPEDQWMANSSGEPPRRRKSGRKRRRRPETSSEESIPRYADAEENVRPYFDVDTDRNSEDTPKRRRKKQEPRPGRWDTEPEDRPIRRREQRRKRPPVETWPSFSEFSEYHAEPAKELKEINTISPLRAVDSEYRHVNEHENNKPVISTYKQYRQRLAEDIGTVIDTAQDINNVPLKVEHNEENETRFETAKKDDISSSLSEFSAEETNPIFVPNTDNDNSNSNMNAKSRSKATNFFKSIDKAQLARSTSSIDPLTLKDILKKSKGTSLSEILQQNNLTLADLLHGKENILSVLKTDNSLARADSVENMPISEYNTEESGGNLVQHSETKYATTTVNNIAPNTDHIAAIDSTTEVDSVQPISEKPKVEEASARPNVRKFPTAARRNQRIRPMMNTTFKSQLSRDMVALNARKYFNSRRRNNQEWKDHVPMMKKNISVDGVNKKLELETTTVYYSLDETTIQEVENCTKVEEPENDQNDTNENLDDIEVITDRQKSVDAVNESDKVELIANTTEKPLVQSTVTPINASSLRRQAFNNRLKKKRLKQKTLLTTESPEDGIKMDLFGIPNLVSSSEFIAQTARPIPTRLEETPKTNLDDVTILEDFITTEMPHRQNRKKTTKNSPRTTTTPHTVFPSVSTEESAKFEIEEIFNDTQTSKKLARILKERNMTLSELVEHRERGSSHVHLADIFYNASKEPNPPEPFLSKSLIEPISKETYPLRVLLDANNHDTTAKTPTTDPVTLQTDDNIPVFMNFGNNVNENAENMGIMSLFHNITRNETVADNKPALKKDSQGTLYETSITVVNTTDGRNENNTIRESRVLHVINDNQDDVVSWNEIFSLMRRNYENQTEEHIKAPINGLLPAEQIKKPALEDFDGDGVIVLEDLQHLKDFDSNIASASNENLDFNSYQRAESASKKAPGFSDKIPSQTRSVTIATASIAGLAMVLFLLTYVGYRWHQQRTMARKNSFSDERVPSPVFENRKGNKNNSSSRSISPMLTSNIYTLNTLDSRNGKESPDYMWDSLRKPFQ